MCIYIYIYIYIYTHIHTHKEYLYYWLIFRSLAQFDMYIYICTYTHIYISKYWLNSYVICLFLCYFIKTSIAVLATFFTILKSWGRFIKTKRLTSHLYIYIYIYIYIHTHTGHYSATFLYKCEYISILPSISVYSVKILCFGGAYGKKFITFIDSISCWKWKVNT